MAVAVVYGRTEKDLDREISKVLSMRSGGGKALESVIDSTDDLRTPRRCHLDNPELDMKNGLADAVEIANTAKNYLQAALLIMPCNDRPSAFSLIDDPSVAEEIHPWLKEKIEPLDPEHAEAWQQRYGRFDKAKAIRSPNRRKKTADGFETL